MERLAALLAGSDLVHVYRGGSPEPLVPEAVRRAGGAPMVETNIFGHLDPTPDGERFACHLFISRMCAMRYRAATGLDAEAFHARHRVSYIPIDLDALRGPAPAPAEAKARLGLDPERPVVGRLGRADERKWREGLLDAMAEVLRRRPDAQVLLVGTTPRLRGRLARLGILDRVVLRDPAADPAELATLYAACDVFATASAIGESFGVGIAEAMALGIPVVTSSTPWTDNAQVELVDAGETGHVADHPRAFAEAVVALMDDPDASRRLGAAARAKAEALFAPGPLARQLEALYRGVRRGSTDVPWSPGWRELAAFEGDYPARARRGFRALTGSEQRAVRLQTARERARWAVRDLRRDPARLLAVVRARTGG